MKNKHEIPVYSGLLIFGAIFFYGTFKIKPGRAATIADSFVPRVAVLTMMALLVVLLVQAIKKQQAEASQRTPEQKAAARAETKRFALRVLFVTAVMGVSVYLMDKLGFVLSMTFYLLCLFIGLAENGKRRWKVIIPLALLFPVLLFILYLDVFSVLLPPGIMKFLT